ncbi:MAG: SDR family NAD(P)-dependent oxidoreductase [Spirochaetota bacterium]
MSEGKNVKRVVIYGAGYSGKKIIREILKERDCYEIVALIDDDARLKNQYVLGVKVNGDIGILPFVLERFDVDEIIVAITYFTSSKFQYLMNAIKGRRITVRTVPSIMELTNDDFSIDEVRELRIEDLLNRGEVEIDSHRTERMLRGKTVLVTGGGGSIGSVIAKKSLEYGAENLFLLGHGENSIFETMRQLIAAFPRAHITPIILDVKDRRGMEGLFRSVRFDTVFHAAAHKHVGLMETNVRECFANNVIGTKTVADAVLAAGIARFAAISTDKAVDPVSVMGISKRIVERYLFSLTPEKTAIATVRFGNVLGSRGSVVPIFERQIEAGGPVTVTSRSIKRYFMTISEAASLVIEASRLASGNELFVLDMGKPVRIADLAKELIRLKGKEGAVSIRYTHPGRAEKINESLFYAYEKRSRSEHRKIWRVTDGIPENGFSDAVQQIIARYENMPVRSLKQAMTSLAVTHGR